MKLFKTREDKLNTAKKSLENYDFAEGFAWQGSGHNLNSGLTVEELKNKLAFFSTLTKVAAVFLFVGHFLFQSFWWMIPCIGVLWYSSVQEWKYSKYAASEIITPEMKKLFPSYRYYPDLGSNIEMASNEDEYKEAITDKYTLLPNLSSLYVIDRDSNEYITNILRAVHNLKKVMIFSLLCSHTTSDSDGHSQTVVTYRGTQVIYDYPCKCTGNVWIYGSGKSLIFQKETTFVSPPKNEGKHKVESGNIEFDNNFEVYADNAVAAHTILNPFVLEKLMNFKNLYGQFALCLTEDKVYISFNKMDKFISFPSNIKELDTVGLNEMKEGVENLFATLDDLCYSISEHTRDSYDENDPSSLFVL